MAHQGSRTRHRLPGADVARSTQSGARFDQRLARHAPGNGALRREAPKRPPSGLEVPWGVEMTFSQERGGPRSSLSSLRKPLPITIVYGAFQRQGAECLPQTVVKTSKRQGFSADLEETQQSVPRTARSDTRCVTHGIRCGRSVSGLAGSLLPAVRPVPGAVVAGSYESGNPGIQATATYEATGAMASKMTPAIASGRPRRLIRTIAIVAR